MKLDRKRCTYPRPETVPPFHDVTSCYSGEDGTGVTERHRVRFMFEDRLDFGQLVGVVMLDL